jgi:hypothetical protein
MITAGKVTKSQAHVLIINKGRPDEADPKILNANIPEP